jgi:two-component system CheB/CheR fusion protein
VLIAEDVPEAPRQQDDTRYLGRIMGQSLHEVYFLDPATLRFTLVNHGAEEKLGYSIRQLRRMAVTEVMRSVSIGALRALVATVHDIADRRRLGTTE